MSGGRTLLWALTTLIAGVSLVTKLLASARRSYDGHEGHGGHGGHGGQGEHGVVGGHGVGHGR